MHVMVMAVIIMMVMAIVIPLLASAPSSLGVRQCPSIDSRILNS